MKKWFAIAFVAALAISVVPSISSANASAGTVGPEACTYGDCWRPWD